MATLVLPGQKEFEILAAGVDTDGVVRDTFKDILEAMYRTAESLGGRRPTLEELLRAQDHKAELEMFAACGVTATLEEIYAGATKKMRITKKIMDASGASVSASSDKDIVIKPGWKDGTKITFPREGDEAPNVIPSDIVFTLQSRPHDRFERDGDDLVYTCPVTLADALTGVRTTVMSLDNRRIPIEARGVTPGTIKVIAGEGMPNHKVSTYLTYMISLTCLLCSLSL